MLSKHFIAHQTDMVDYMYCVPIPYTHVLIFVTWQSERHLCSVIVVEVRTEILRKLPGRDIQRAGVLRTA